MDAVGNLTHNLIPGPTPAKIVDSQSVGANVPGIGELFCGDGASGVEGFIIVSVVGAKPLDEIGLVLEREQGTEARVPAVRSAVKVGNNGFVVDSHDSFVYFGMSFMMDSVTSSTD